MSFHSITRWRPEDVLRTRAPVGSTKLSGTSTLILAGSGQPAQGTQYCANGNLSLRSVGVSKRWKRDASNCWRGFTTTSVKRLHLAAGREYIDRSPSTGRLLSAGFGFVVARVRRATL